MRECSWSTRMPGSRRTTSSHARGGGSALRQVNHILAAPLPADVLRDVRAIVESHAGSAPIEVRWRDHNGANARFRSRSLKIAVTNAALNELRALLGDERVRLVRGS